MQSMVFNIASEQIGNNSIDWINDTDIRFLLLAGAGEAAKANATVAAVLANSNVAEVDATNYERKTLGTKAVSQSADKTRFGSADATYLELGGANNDEITGWLIYKGTTDPADDATNIPIAVIAAATPLTTNGGDVTVKPDTTDLWFFLDNS